MIQRSHPNQLLLSSTSMSSDLQQEKTFISFRTNVKHIACSTVHRSQYIHHMNIAYFLIQLAYKAMGIYILFLSFEFLVWG